MKRLSVMVLAGEASGDTLAAELVRALRDELAVFQTRPTDDVQPLFTSLEPRFFGMGGQQMAAAGVELVEDMSAWSVFGVADVLRRYLQFRGLLRRLVCLAIARQPDVIVCVDFSGFNRRFARALRDHVRAREGSFDNWRPRIVQFVSPQVWASRPGRARQLARDFDLLLSIFPFEKAWYAEHAPGLRVEFVGHPMLDRFAPEAPGQNAGRSADGPAGGASGAAATGRLSSSSAGPPRVVLLPGSRPRELQRHLPAMLEAARQIHAAHPAHWHMVLPDESLAAAARALLLPEPPIQVQVGRLAEVLAHADLALASSGTVTLECACFGVPAVVLYKLSWLEFQIARRIVRVKHIAMPNLLAGETVFPEFIQHEVTPENLSRAALALLQDETRCENIRTKLRQVIASLGGPGASRRAARQITALLAAG